MSFADRIRDLPMRARRLRPDSQTIDRPGWHQVITPSCPSDRFNGVEISGVDGDPRPLLDETIDAYRRCGADFKLAVFPAAGADVTIAYLESLGLATWTARAMWCPTDLAIGVPAGVEAGEVGAGEREGFVALAAAAWEMDPKELDDHADLFADPDVHLYVARAGDQPLGTAAAIDVDELVYLSGAAIRREARGRGGYRALIAGRLAGARARGIARAGTHAREQTSAPILERLGFETLFRYRMFASRAP